MYDYEENNYDRGFNPLSTAQGLLTGVMTRVYGWMMAALLITTGVALFTVSSPAMLSLIYGNSAAIWVLFIVEIGLVIWLSAGINKMSQSTATIVFLLYAALNGLVLSGIFFTYELGTIYAAFGASALTFGAMSFVGYVTKRDLSGLGGILLMALIGIIIASVVNIFWANSTLDSIITYVGVFLFVGLTAYDTQRIKQMVSYSDASVVGKVAILGALSLYLDFINLFLYILRLLGRSRN